jgi:hypothetical protein
MSATQLCCAAHRSGNFGTSPSCGKMWFTFLRTRDSDRCADWWMNYWQGPWTLADYGYANCTHQNSQEGTWRPVRRGTGCGAKGDERQALGSLIKMGRPNAISRQGGLGCSSECAVQGDGMLDAFGSGMEDDCGGDISIRRAHIGHVLYTSAPALRASVSSYSEVSCSQAGGPSRVWRAGGELQM